MTVHDASRVLLGSTGSSDRQVSCEVGDPATFKAGLVVRRATTGALQLADDATAVRIGVSLGIDLSDAKKTAVCRVGNQVPVLLKDEGEFASLVVGDLTFTAKAKGEDGNDIEVTLADTESDGGAVVEVTGTGIVIGIEDGVTTAATIAAAIEASAAASALVSVEVADGEDATAQAAAVLDNLAGGADSFPYVVKGDKVKTDDATGEASSDGDESNAVYVSGPLTGVYPDGTTAYCALVDMGGGL